MSQEKEEEEKAEDGKKFERTKEIERVENVHFICHKFSRLRFHIFSFFAFALLPFKRRRTRCFFFRRRVHFMCRTRSSVCVCVCCVQYVL